MSSNQSDDQLRRESPAYDRRGWEELEPQAMNVVLSVRLDARAAREVTALARATGRSPSRLIRDWTLERLAAMQSERADERTSSAVSEEAPVYDTADADAEVLRNEYRPERIDVLLVGESRPASGTFFYRSNSKLYYATHEAFQVAFGRMQSGDDFLGYLKRSGVWLYDLAPSPVNRLRGRPRRDAVRERVADLVDILRGDQPRLVIAVKRDLEPVVRAAVTDAGLPEERVHVLPFPLYQWRGVYIQQLASLLAGVGPTARQPGEGGDRPRA